MSPPALAFEIAGDPVPQPRPRVTTRGRFPHAYVPASHPIHAYRQSIAAAAVAAGAEPATESVNVVIDFVFARPKSHYGKRGVLPSAPQLPRFDIDNTVKACLDALNGVAWVDDSQVRRIVAEKSYGAEGRTTVRIS
jgi:Holliday junction resolvase RusA-like endonuclease